MEIGPGPVLQSVRNSWKRSLSELVIITPIDNLFVFCSMEIADYRTGRQSPFRLLSEQNHPFGCKIIFRAKFIEIDAAGQVFSIKNDVMGTGI